MLFVVLLVFHMCVKVYAVAACRAPASGLRMVPAFTGPGGPAEEPGCSAELRWIDADVVEYPALA